MDDSPRSSNAELGADHGTTTPTPRWVKVFGIIALVVVLLLVIVMLTGGGGGHGPGRHTGSSGVMGDGTPPDAVG